MDSGTLSIKKWVVMYPVYINSKKTVAEGRRISLSKSCENPNCIEISDCCKHLKLPSAVEVIFDLRENVSLMIVCAVFDLRFYGVFRLTKRTHVITCK